MLARPFVALEGRPPRLVRSVRITVIFRQDQLVSASLRIFLPEVEPLLLARRWQTRQDRADDSTIEVGFRYRTDLRRTV